MTVASGAPNVRKLKEEDFTQSPTPPGFGLTLLGCAHVDYAIGKKWRYRSEGFDASLAP